MGPIGDGGGDIVSAGRRAGRGAGGGRGCGGTGGEADESLVWIRLMNGKETEVR